MTLNASGPISLGGSTPNQSVNLELSQSATATISMNDANVRALAGVSSGAISLPNNFWGKSAIQYLFAFAGTENEVYGPSGIATDSSNNSYVVASSFDIYGIILMKITAAGSVSWKTKLTITGTGYSAVAKANVALDSSGNIYVCAYYSDATYTTTQICVFKYDSSGALQWKKQLANTQGSNQPNYVTIDSSNNIYVVGYTQATSAQIKGTILKYNTAGTLQWQRNLTNPNGTLSSYNCFFTAATCDSSGNIYVAGRYQPGSSCWLIKYDSSGNILWNKTLGGSSTLSFDGVVLDSSNNVYVMGRYDAVNGAIYAKYNSSGTLQWQKSLVIATPSQALNYTQVGLEMSVDSSNNIYVAIGEAAAGRQYVLSFDTSGTIRWANKISGTAGGGSTYAYMTSVKISADGSMHVWAEMPLSTVGTSRYYLGILPTDGSKTGTYSLSGVTITYSSVSTTVASTTQTDGTWTASPGTPTYTDTTAPGTTSTPTITNSVVTI